MLKLALIADQKEAKAFIPFFNQKKREVEKIIQKKLELKYILKTEPENKEAGEKIAFPEKLKQQPLKADFEEIIADPELDLILELNSAASSLEYFLKSLKNSITLISSNKKIAAENYQVLKEYEKKYKGRIYLGAAFSPLALTGMLENFYFLDEIKELKAIFNSTTNYILSEMEKETISMKETMKKAEKNSFIEKNPDIDLSGLDSLYQLVLSANLIYNTVLPLEKIDYKGIKGITSYDLIYAAELGYKIKLLAEIKKNKGRLQLGIRPVLLPQESFLASVDQNSNGIVFYSENKGESVFRSENTLQAGFDLLLLDLIKFVRTDQKEKTYQNFGTKNIKVDNLYSSHKNEFYIRLQIKKDKAVIDKIKEIFSDKNLADLILQDKLTETPLLPVIIISKKIREFKLEKILKEVENLEGVLTVNNIIPLQKN